MLDCVGPRCLPHTQFQNNPRRFESRWVQVAIAEDTPSLWLQGMGGASIGVWCAHGEGQALFPSAEVEKQVLASGLAPIR